MEMLCLEGYGQCQERGSAEAVEELGEHDEQRQARLTARQAGTGLQRKGAQCPSKKSRAGLVTVTTFSQEANDCQTSLQG